MGVARTTVASRWAPVTVARYTRPVSDGVRIGIIGTGWVGSSVAISTLHAGIAHEILLHDIKPAIAEGEAMDLSHGSSFYPAAIVRFATLDEMRDATAIVVSAG